MIAGWKKTSQDKEVNKLKKEGKIVKEFKKAKEDIRNGKSKAEVSVPFSKFPIAKWLEWNEDCEKNFGGCRWAKAYMNHLKVKEANQIEAIWARIAEIETRLTQPEEEDVPVNLHGEPLR